MYGVCRFQCVLILHLFCRPTVNGMLRSLTQSWPTQNTIRRSSNRVSKLDRYTSLKCFPLARLLPPPPPHTHSQCKECGRGFSVRYNLLMHIQTIHGQPQRYKCPVRGCKEAFHSQPRLNGHLKKVHKKDVKSMEKWVCTCLAHLCFYRDLLRA